MDLTHTIYTPPICKQSTAEFSLACTRTLYRSNPVHTEQKLYNINFAICVHVHGALARGCTLTAITLISYLIYTYIHVRARALYTAACVCTNSCRYLLNSITATARAGADERV